MLAWILHENTLDPGYLIGGVPENFGESARLGTTPFFVIEADEYDTAFCDKRSKFVHYRPRTLILNNLEFDHADIFANLSAIQTQFNHLLKTVPQGGQIVYNQNSPELDEVLDMGCWSELKSFNTDTSDWRAIKEKDDASSFNLEYKDKQYLVEWPLIGDHNMANAVAAIAAAHHVGVPIAHSVKSLASFKSVKRRMELIFDDSNIRIYDDFAHHPTAISETLSGLRSSVGGDNIIAILEPRSNTMKRGIHKHLLQGALSNANHALIYADDNVKWDINELESESIQTFDNTELLLEQLSRLLEVMVGKTNILIMSNGGFDNLYQRLISRLQKC